METNGSRTSAASQAQGSGAIVNVWQFLECGGQTLAKTTTSSFWLGLSFNLQTCVTAASLEQTSTARENVKGTRGKKQDQLVYLSRFSLAQFKRLHTISGQTNSCFPSRDAEHDLRRTAATMMQALGVSPDVIDRCQNHVLSGSRVRRHYMKHEYADEKRAAWELLGTELECILSGATPPQAEKQRSEALDMLARELTH